MPQALLALVAWTLFAFAGAYRWTLVAVIPAAFILLGVARPRLFGAGSRLLDGALVAGLAAIGSQLLPLPAAMRDSVSPAARVVQDSLRVGVTAASYAPLTLDPSSTAWALALASALVAVFWSARATVEARGLREVSRGVAWLGIALSIVVFVQRFTSPHLATWLVLAVPLGSAMPRPAWSRVCADAPGSPSSSASSMDGPSCSPARSC